MALDMYMAGDELDKNDSDHDEETGNGDAIALHQLIDEEEQ